MKNSVKMLCLGIVLSSCTGCKQSEEATQPKQAQAPTNNNDVKIQEIQRDDAQQNDAQQQQNPIKEPSMEYPVKPGQVLPIDQFQKATTGLESYIVTPSEGAKPFAGETVEVHYSGYVFDPKTNTVGKKFDSSVDRGQTFEFVLGGNMVIKGWELALAQMHKGETRIIILPPHLGYGARGAGNAIPGNATILFEVELIAIH